MPRLPSFDPDCEILFDGEPLPARRGEPVAVALLALGRPLIGRSMKYHRPRGPYCLAGSCMSCLTRIDGLPNQRACRTPCREGLVVESQNAFPSAGHDLLGALDTVFAGGLDHHHLMTFNGVANRMAVAFSRRLSGLGKLPAPSALPLERSSASVSEEALDALIVGGGPSGLAAAEALARPGLRLSLLDSGDRLGGRLRCEFKLPGDRGRDWIDRVARQVAASGGEVALRSSVVGLWQEAGGILAAVASDGPPQRVRLFRSARVVLCPGGNSVTPPIAGGDRPGVFAARGLAIAIAEHGALPGERAAVLGTGPEADAIASVLKSAGVAVERASLSADLRILGRGRVRGLAGRGTRVACDFVVAATPPAPLTDLARALGARVRFDAREETFAVEAGLGGETGVPGLWVAGEATGPMDAAGAADSGQRAGESAR